MVLGAGAILGSDGALGGMGESACGTAGLHCGAIKS